MPTIDIIGRLSYPELDQPKSFNGSAPVFSAHVVVPKSDTRQIAQIERAMAEAAQARWGEKASTILAGLKAQLKVALHDGSTKPENAEYRDAVYVSARNKVRPLLVDRHGNAISWSDGILYSGCYVLMRVEFWAQDNPQFGKRLNATLKGVQFFRNGDRFAGGSSAKLADFKDLGDEDADPLF